MGIVWVVINNLVTGGAEQIELSQKCIAVDLKATAANCGDVGGNWTCNVTYERKVGGEDIDGIKIVLYNGLTSFIHDVPGNLGQPAQRTETEIDTEIAIGQPEPNRVQLVAYFEDDSGIERPCNPTGQLNF